MITQASPNVQYAVELRQVSKVYPGTPPVVALSDVSFSVVHGEFVSIVGASGSGKSTLLHVIGTLTRPTTGDVFIDGINTDGLSDRGLSGLRAKSVGFVFQEFFLLPGFSAVQNVANGLLYSGVPVSERLERAKGMLERVGLAHRMEHRPNEMSGGEQQRVALARALVHDPAFVLADEPSGNLDSQNTSAVMDLLGGLNQDGTTVILITHDLEVAQISTRQVTLKDGYVEDHPDRSLGAMHE